ncbi:hypothetical protein niasHS_003741 [Heterodera schachtii]|uniref:DUF5648 domain-containing protein n=1 Tax=Heterodera schachtii TaxID=97005 RepID=A0ABD2KHD1_HETSC
MGAKNNGDSNLKRRSRLIIDLAYRSALLLLLANQRHLARTTFSWPRARIPFEDDPRLLVDPDQAVALNNARMDLQVRTCVRLVPRRAEADYVFFSDLGPHIECWNMFEPFPPKGRILVNAGTSCLEPMRRPHRPRRVFSDCDIEYINHLYNCPRRRKSSPICPAGRLIMAKPMELRQLQHHTTPMAEDEEELDMTSTNPMPTTTMTKTTTIEMEEVEDEEGEGEAQEEEEDVKEQGEREGDGEEGTENTTPGTETETETDGEREKEREGGEGKGDTGGAAAEQSAEWAEEILGNFQHSFSTTSLPNGITESEIEAKTAADRVFDTTIRESAEAIASEKSQNQPEMTTTGQEMIPSAVPTTALPEMLVTEANSKENPTGTTVESVPEPTKSNTIPRRNSTITTLTEAEWSTVTEPNSPKKTIERMATTEQTTIEQKTTEQRTTEQRTTDQMTTEQAIRTTSKQQPTTSYLWSTMTSTPSVISPFVSDRTVSLATADFFSTTQQILPKAESDPPLRHPFPLMMTLITTTTTTTIAPPPPDWVRSVEESFRIGDQSVDRTKTSSTEKPGTAGRRTSSSTSVEEKQPKASEEAEPKPKTKPKTMGPAESEQSGAEEDEKSSRPLVVGLIELPPGEGLAIREKTKVTKVIEKTKYIGPCGSACHYDGQLVRLYRSINNKPSVMDHFYTTERLEQHLMASQGYVMEPAMGFLGRNQIDPNCTCIRPLYRMYSEFANDHFLTASEQEKAIAEGLLGYVHQRILGYCTNEPGCGAYVPLYRFFSAVNRDHFYTADQQEMHYYKTHAELTYAFEKIECYVWQHNSSARGCPAVPLLGEREQRRDVQMTISIFPRICPSFPPFLRHFPSSSANSLAFRRHFSLTGPRHSFFFDYFTKHPKDMPPLRDYLPRPTWVKHGNEFPLRQLLPGHYDDPEWHPKDRGYAGSPRFGDKIPEDIMIYRRSPTEEEVPFLHKAMHKLMSMVFWYWVFYTIYWHHQEQFTGEWYMPYHYEWSDEELGVPPDDAPDPEERQFWGHPGELIGTYRA